MFPWDVLGIAPTDDRKAIKKAYAGLLRQHRPDHDPEGFQRTNQAYKAAISMVDSNSGSASQEVGGTSEEAPTASIELSIEHPSDATDLVQNEAAVAAENVHHQTLVKNLFEQVQATITAPIEYREKLKNWQFLQHYDEIHDFNLRVHVAMDMFQLFSEFNMSSLQRNRIMPLPSQVMKFVDGVFGWSENWQTLVQYFPKTQLEAVFDLLDIKNGAIDPTYRPSVIRRGVAFFLDVWAYLMGMGLLINVAAPLVGWQVPKDMQILLFLLGFLAYRLGFGLFSNGNQTFGAKAMRYRFLDRFVSKPEKLTVLKRELLNELKLLPFYLTSLGWLHGSMVFNLLGIIALCDVGFALLNRQRMIQDKCSGSLAVSI